MHAPHLDFRVALLGLDDIEAGGGEPVAHIRNMRQQGAEPSRAQSELRLVMRGYEPENPVIDHIAGLVA